MFLGSENIKSVFELFKTIAFAAGGKTVFRGVRLIICAGFVLGVLAGCFEVEKVSEKKPYAVSVKKERSYYQAQKIVEHLADLGIPSYVVEKGEDKDRYYHVVTKPFRTEDEAENFREHLASKEMEKGEIFSFDDLSEEERKNLANRKIYMQEERKRIPAETPDVPRSILSTIRKVPGSNAFYIGRMNLVNLDLTDKGKIYSLGLSTDLPRGVKLSYFAEHGNAFAEIRLVDNLYGDQVTFEILNLKPGENAETLASEIADDILATGEYDVEEKIPYFVASYDGLGGYRVTIEVPATKKSAAKQRSYTIVGDRSSEYLFIVQDAGRDDPERISRLLSQIGKSNGLEDYDEFWNSFYLIPKNLDGDVFIAYASEKMGPSYARTRGNALWAKRIVGHWTYSMYFYAPKKGVWNYAVFDLLTEPYCGKTWEIYSKQVWEAGLNFCGTRGHVIKNWGTITELNYRFDRYVLTINPHSGNFSQSSLISRAERFQYACGR